MSRSPDGWPFDGGYVTRDENTGQIDWLDVISFERARKSSAEQRSMLSNALGNAFVERPIADPTALALHVLSEGPSAASESAIQRALGGEVLNFRVAPSAATASGDFTTVDCVLGSCPVSLLLSDVSHALWIEALVAPSRTAVAAGGAAQVRLWPYGDKWAVSFNESVPLVFETRLAAHDHLVRTAWRLSHPHRRWLALLHAAAVHTTSHIIILAGTSGAGKSSLAALLLTNGARQLADDLVAVDAETREILPVPLSTSVKAGSWAALPDTWRELVAQPPLILPRSDTRFVQLKAAYRAGGPSLLPTTVVFPVYETDAEPTIIRLRPLELLAGLGHTGSFFPEDDATLQSFLSWAEQTPAYVLNYGDGELALELLFDTLHRVVHSSRFTPPSKDIGDRRHG